MSLIFKSSTQVASSAQKQGGVPSVARRSTRLVAKAAAHADQTFASRRQVLNASVVTAAAFFVPQLPALAAKAPSGFSAAENLNYGYKFLYPFGWQEISVKGTDIVFKDVIEALESVSVTIIGTDKSNISEFGDINVVCEALAKNVLSSPGQEVKLIKTNERADEKGRKYYEFEFTASNPGYTRHQVSVVSVADGSFFTLTTGSSERRWGKMQDKLNTVIRSFTLSK